MTWAAQALHMVRHDLRTRWPLLAALTALVAATVLSAVGLLGTDATGVVVVLLPGAFTGLAMGVVQADQPARGDVFWATLPYRPSAVAAAKLLHVFALTLLCLAGTAIVLAAFDVGAPEATRTLAVRLWTSLALAIPAAHLGSMAYDRLMTQAAGKARLGIVALLMFCVLAVFVMRSTSVVALVNRVPVVVDGLAFVTATWLFIRTYERRERSMPMVVAIVVACLLLVLSLLRTPTPTRTEAARMPTDSASLTLRPAAGRPDGMDMLRTEGGPGTVERLVDGTLALAMRGGAHDTVFIDDRWLQSPYFLPPGNRLELGLGAAPAAVTLVDGRLVARDSSAVTARVPETLPLLDDAARAPRGTRATPTRATLAATLERYELRAFAHLPLQRAGRVRGPGWTGTFETVPLPADSGGIEIQLDVTSLRIVRSAAPWRHRASGSGEGPRFVLRDRHTGLVTPLLPVATSSFTGDGNLLGTGTDRLAVTLHASPAGGATPPVDTTNFARMDLVLLTPVLVSGRRVHAAWQAP